MRYFSLLKRWTEANLAFFNLRDSCSPLVPLIFIPPALANSSLKHALLIRHGNRWHFRLAQKCHRKRLLRGVPHLQHLCKEGSRLQDHSHQAHTKHFITVVFCYKTLRYGKWPLGANRHEVQKQNLALHLSLFIYRTGLLKYILLSHLPFKRFTNTKASMFANVPMLGSQAIRHHVTFCSLYLDQSAVLSYPTIAP